MFGVLPNKDQRRGRRKDRLSHKVWLIRVLGDAFGLTNAPATFCTLMNDIFREWLDDFVVIYIDDILIYSSSMEEHAEHLRKVFQRLKENKLYVKLEKCEFGVMEVDFLGHRITQDGLMMDDHKVKAILGLASYYRKFIKNFAKMGAPLTNLLKNSTVTYDWDQACDEAFETLKGILVKASMLKLPDLDKDFEIHSDAFDFAIGGVIVLQRCGSVHRQCDLEVLRNSTQVVIKTTKVARHIGSVQCGHLAQAGKGEHSPRCLEPETST
jgi:hypothetical protein